MKRNVILCISMILLVLAGCGRTDVELPDEKQMDEDTSEELPREDSALADTLTYECHDNEGELQLVLSYDEKTKTGSVVLVNEEKEIPIQQVETAKWKGTDYYSMQPVGETAPEWTAEIEKNVGISDFQERKEWDEVSKNPLYYEAKANLGDIYLEEEKNKDPESILKIIWNYDESGKLLSRQYTHHPLVFGTSYLYWNTYFDEKERVAYERAYITHGSLNYFYLYDEEQKTPKMCLLLDDMSGEYWTVLTVYEEE